MVHKPKTIKIHSENNEFQHAEVLKRNRVKRSKYNKFFVEGKRPITLAIKNKWEIDTFLYSNAKKCSTWVKDILSKSTAKKHIEMPKVLLDKLSDKEDGSELLALVKMRRDGLDRIKIKKDLFVVVIDKSSNPGNLGTIIRSCNSFGVDAIIMTGHSVDLYDTKTIRASIGTLFALPVIRLGSHNDVIPWIKKVKSKIGRFDVIGTSVKTEKMINEIRFKKPLMLLVGNERYGLTRTYEKN